MSLSFILAPSAALSSTTNPTGALSSPTSPSTSHSSAKTHLPPAPSLHLLPFTLGTPAAPYSSTSAPISSFFQPRPAPDGIPGITAGKLLASFRGRQVVGQRVCVPRGYKGVILSTESIQRARMAYGVDSVDGNSAGIENGEEQGDGVGAGRPRRGAKKDAWPPTPVASTASVSAGTSASTDAGGDDDDLSLRRSPRKGGMAGLKQRVMGAGQTALARPRRAVARVTKKRIRLDSDDEDEDEAEDGRGQGTDRSTGVANGGVDAHPPTPPRTPRTPIRTPSKRQKNVDAPTPTPTRQSPRFPRTPAPNSSARAMATPLKHVPAITLQEATPLKSPLPAPPPYMALKRGGRADFVIGGAGEEVEEEESTGVLAGVATPGSPTPSIGAASQVDGTESVDSGRALGREESEGGIIPSPATENDPPSFHVESIDVKVEYQTNIDLKDNVNPEIYGIKEEYSGPVRILRPTSQFASFTLWTPDCALGGYVEPPVGEETVTNEREGADGAKKEETENKEEEGSRDEGQPLIRKGWWAPGGGGEGGDEVVRALGEWIGLVEMIHDPVYLVDGQGEDDDDDDED